MSRPIRVLLLGSHTPSAALLRHFERHECECSFANTIEESRQLFRTRGFDLVLSTCRMSDALQMICSPGRGNLTAFCALPVEEGYWWLPLMNKGRKSMGEPALRPKEFADVLDRLLEEIRRDQSIAEERLAAKVQSDSCSTSHVL